MKKTRKLLALLMALAIALSILTFPASAATKPDEEPVSPEYVALQCFECLGPAELVEREEYVESKVESPCGYNSLPSNHYHDYYTVYEYRSCRNCGDALVGTGQRVYCLGKLIRET